MLRFPPPLPPPGKIDKLERGTKTYLIYYIHVHKKYAECRSIYMHGSTWDDDGRGEIASSPRVIILILMIPKKKKTFLLLSYLQYFTKPLIFYHIKKYNNIKSLRKLLI